MKNKIDELNKLYLQIQNLLSETNWRGFTMKYKLMDATSTEEIREGLLDIISLTPYKNDHKKLAKKLSLRYPTGGWSERVLNNMLNKENGSKSIDGARMNQIIEFLIPAEKSYLTLDELKDQIDYMYEGLGMLRKEFNDCVRIDKKIDNKEFELLSARVGFLQNFINKFIRNISTNVNVQLG